jgi:hypothetical protein
MALWRYYPIEPSTAPVFSYPPAAEKFDSPGDFAVAIQLYNADRGAECKLTTADGSKLTVFYFEWDCLEAGPMMMTVGHAPEECNLAAGFKLQGSATNRTYQVPGQLPLVFDCTHFKDPADQDTFIFKLAWMQGLGSKSIREGQSGVHRVERLANSFIRHAGATRVLQVVVSDGKDIDHAWQVAQSEVLEKLEWK